jgi:hypothetical protein
MLDFLLISLVNFKFLTASSFLSPFLAKFSIDLILVKNSVFERKNFERVFLVCVKVFFRLLYKVFFLSSSFESFLFSNCVFSLGDIWAALFTFSEILQKLGISWFEIQAVRNSTCRSTRYC